MHIKEFLQAVKNVTDASGHEHDQIGQFTGHGEGSGSGGDVSDVTDEDTSTRINPNTGEEEEGTPEEFQEIDAEHQEEVYQEAKEKADILNDSDMYQIDTEEGMQDALEDMDSYNQELMESDSSVRIQYFEGLETFDIVDAKDVDEQYAEAETTVNSLNSDYQDDPEGQKEDAEIYNSQAEEAGSPYRLKPSFDENHYQVNYVGEKKFNPALLKSRRYGHSK